jgi:hypothetical protein
MQKHGKLPRIGRDRHRAQWQHRLSSASRRSRRESRPVTTDWVRRQSTARRQGLARRGPHGRGRRCSPRRYSRRRHHGCTFWVARGVLLVGSPRWAAPLPVLLCAAVVVSATWLGRCRGDVAGWWSRTAAWWARWFGAMDVLRLTRFMPWPPALVYDGPTAATRAATDYRPTHAADRPRATPAPPSSQPSMQAYTLFS